MIRIEEPRGRSSCNSCGCDVDIQNVFIGRNEYSGTAHSLCIECRAELCIQLDKSVVGSIGDKKKER